MMKEEFEKIAGYKVTGYDYRKFIEPMYMSTSLSKEEFAKSLNKKFFELTPKKEDLAEIRNYANELQQNAKNNGEFFAPLKFRTMLEDYARKYYDSNNVWIGAGIKADGAMYPLQFMVLNEHNDRVLTTIKLIC